MLQTGEAASAIDPRDGAPVGQDVACPLCGYNLRGLVEPRCPECGYAFQWRELLSPEFRSHPYLFEHAEQHLARSLWRTAVGGLRPTAFWSSVYPTQPSRPARLLVYWFVCALVFAASVMLMPVAGLLAYYRRMNIAILPDDVAEWFAAAPRMWPGLLLLAWPWLTLATLMIFRVSMRRARVRPAHVVRCVLYSFDAYLWLGIIFVLTAAAAALLKLSWEFWTAPPLLFAAAIAVTFMAARLSVAYRRYLRFDHPRATVLASQIIVSLVMLIVFASWLANAK